MTRSLFDAIRKWDGEHKRLNKLTPPFYALKEEIDALAESMFLVPGEPPADGKTRIWGVEIQAVDAEKGA